MERVRPAVDLEEVGFAFMVRSHGRTFYTNSERRWRLHHRRAARMRIPGEYFRWDASSRWESPQFRPVWQMRIKGKRT